MKPEDSTLDEARAAKAKAAAVLGDFPVVGLGITRCGTGYGVKVNLSEAVAGRPLPEEIDGVPIKAEVVGKITKR